MARKALLVLVTVLFSARPHTQTALVLVLVLGFLGIHIKLQPFESDDVDWMEGYSLCLTAALFLLGQFLFARGEQSAGERALVTVLLSTAMLAFVVGFPLLAARIVYRERAQTRALAAVAKEGGAAGPENLDLAAPGVELAVLPPTTVSLGDLLASGALGFADEEAPLPPPPGAAVTPGSLRLADDEAPLPPPPVARHASRV
jgi:hypothetical protein